MRSVMQLELNIKGGDDVDESQRGQIIRELFSKVGLRDKFEDFKELRKEVVSLLQNAEFKYESFYDKLASSTLTPEERRLLETDPMRKQVEKICKDVRNILEDMPLDKVETEGHKVVALSYVAGLSITDYACLVTGSSNLTTFRLRTKTDSFKHSTEACQAVYKKLFPLTKKVQEVKMREGVGTVKARLVVEDKILAFEKSSSSEKPSSSSSNPIFVGQIIGNRLFPIIWKENRFEVIMMLFSGLLAILLFWQTPSLTIPVAEFLENWFGSWKNTDMVYGTLKIDSTYISYIRSSLERLDTGFWVAFITMFIQLITKTGQLYLGKDIKWKLSD